MKKENESKRKMSKISNFKFYSLFPNFIDNFFSLEYRHK